MMPPNWLNDQFPQTRPHLYNHWCSPQYGCWWMGRYIQHNHPLVWMNPLGMNARKIYLSAGMSAMKTDFRNTVPLDMLFEDGQFHYGRTDPFNCMYGLCYNEDRRLFYMPHRTQANLDPWELEEGYGQGCVLHLLHNRNVEESIWSPMDATNNHHGYVRMRLACPMYTSYHVVYGDPQHPFSGAKFIRYFQYYRPVPRPKMFWFTFD